MNITIEDDWQVVNRDVGEDEEEGVQDDGATSIAKDADADTGAQDKDPTKQGSETNYESQGANSAIQCTLTAGDTMDTVPGEGFRVGGKLAITRLNHKKRLESQCKDTQVAGKKYKCEDKRHVVTTLYEPPHRRSFRCEDGSKSSYICVNCRVRKITESEAWNRRELVAKSVLSSHN